MTKRSIPRIGKTRSKWLGVYERDDLNGSQSCGLHQGQRPREPQLKAGHMTAPTNTAINTKNILPCGGQWYGPRPRGGVESPTSTAMKEKHHADRSDWLGPGKVCL